MPAELLFDISEIDLRATVADRAAIATIIPHRGDMLQIDRIVWHDPSYDLGIAVKEVRDDEFWVPGHIPGYPILPGVLMVEASAQFASWMYHRRSGKDWFAGFTRIDDTTFRGQVVPGDTLYLLCKCLKYQLKRFVCHCQGVVNGQIAFESKVTGMAFPKMQTPVRGPLTEVRPRRSATGSVVRS